MGITMIFSMRGVRATGRPVSFFPKGALIHHLQSRRWYPSRWVGPCALPEASAGHFSRGGRQCRKRTSPVQSALYFALSAKRCGGILPLIPPPACENLPLAALSQLWVCHVIRHTHFLFRKEKQKKTKGR